MGRDTEDHAVGTSIKRLSHLKAIKPSLRGEPESTDLSPVFGRKEPCQNTGFAVLWAGVAPVNQSDT